MSEYRLAPLARTDLEEIWLYVARNGRLDAADRLIDSILDCFGMLARMPHAGAVRPDIDTNVRSFPVSRYMIYYREHAQGGVLIARVLHAMRDQQKAWDLD